MNTLPVLSRHTPERNWRTYYAAVCDRPASYLATITLPHVEFKGSFLDLGCGTMNDSRFSLDAGFHRVIAVDASSDARQYATELSDRYRARFCFIQSGFDEFDFSKATHSWVHSNFALPHFGSTGFTELVGRIKGAVADSGIFSGIFFGENDEWSKSGRDLAFVTKQALLELFHDFRIILLEEIDRDGHCHNRRPKHWNYFRLIAKKSDANL